MMNNGFVTMTNCDSEFISVFASAVGNDRKLIAIGSLVGAENSVEG